MKTAEKRKNGNCAFRAAGPSRSGAARNGEGTRRETAAARRSGGACGVGAEAKRQFAAWFRRNFPNPRAGIIGRAAYLRAGALDDRPGDGVWYADAYERAVLDHTEALTPTEEAFLREHPLIGLQLLLGFTDVRAVRCLRRGLTRNINALQRKSYRSRYYARDNARRRLLAAERRKIRRRTTLAACPTPEEFRAAFARVGDSVEAKILFGGLVHDLECHVDNGLRIDGRGEIVGRNGGVKQWIFENAPELYPRYKTIMRYKALARRVRQAAGVKDPVPTAALFGREAGAAPLSPAEPRGGRAADAERESPEKDSRGRAGGTGAVIARAKRRIAKALRDCPNTVAETFRRVDAMLGEGPD